MNKIKNNKQNKILVTGGAGFIGSALANKLVSLGHEVVVVDNYNDYYDPDLKRKRTEVFLKDVSVEAIDITNKEALSEIFAKNNFSAVCHLAAQAGVRYSVEAPEVYVNSNVLGTQVLYEVMKKFSVKQMVFASTSSVYGNSTESPFKEDACAAEPVSVYAATKRAGELLAYTYFSQYQIETTCLRFFTVYGPWSRPDMAMLKFANKIVKGESIDVYNAGDLKRDFTYIDDIVNGFVLALEKPLGYEIINLGNGSPVLLTDFIKTLEAELGIVSTQNNLPMQQGDVYETYADITKANKLLGYKPETSFNEGIKEFVYWFKSQ